MVVLTVSVVILVLVLKRRKNKGPKPESPRMKTWTQFTECIIFLMEGGLIKVILRLQMVMIIMENKESVQ